MGKKDDDIIYEDGCPEWMLTMGDTMSLLVTFFVLLLSFSSKHEDKLLDALGGIKGALSIAPTTGSGTPGLSNAEDTQNPASGDVQGGTTKEILISKDSVTVVNLRSIKIKNRFNEFRERIMDLGFKNYISMNQLDDGIYIDVPCDIIFRKESAQLDFNAPKILEGFANLANSVGNEVQVTACFKFGEGDDSSNSFWELSDRRINAIADMLNTNYNINRRRFSYGYRILPSGEPYIRLLLAEKIKINEVTDITEFINQSQSQ